MAGINITVKPRKADFARVDRLLRKLSPDKNRDIWNKGLSRAALLIAKIVTEEEIVRGRGKDAEPLPTQLSSRTGTLIRSIAPDFSEIPRMSSVGTDLVYGSVHEEGEGRFPRRPFLEPAGEKAGDRFADIMIGVIREETGL